MLFVKYIKELWELVVLFCLIHIVKTLLLHHKEKIMCHQQKSGPGYKSFSS